MTCIVGIECNGKVFIAGDIQWTGSNNKVTHTQPKVFIKGGVVFGCSGSCRYGQLIEHTLGDLVAPESGFEVYSWLVAVLIPQIKNALKEGGCDGDGSALIGVMGQLWELQSDYSVLRSKSGYCAIGSGHEYAYGAMHVLCKMQQPMTDDAAEKAVRTAVEAAGSMSPSVGIESTVMQTR